MEECRCENGCDNRAHARFAPMAAACVRSKFHNTRRSSLFSRCLGSLKENGVLLMAHAYRLETSESNQRYLLEFQHQGSPPACQARCGFPPCLEARWFPSISENATLQASAIGI